MKFQVVFPDGDVFPIDPACSLQLEIFFSVMLNMQTPLILQFRFREATNQTIRRKTLYSIPWGQFIKECGSGVALMHHNSLPIFECTLRPYTIFYPKSLYARLIASLYKKRTFTSQQLMERSPNRGLIAQILSNAVLAQINGRWSTYRLFAPIKHSRKCEWSSFGNILVYATLCACVTFSCMYFSRVH